MGRITELFHYINLEKLPSKTERSYLFTHLDTESKEVKRIRKEYRASVKKEARQELAVPQGARS